MFNDFWHEFFICLFSILFIENTILSTLHPYTTETILREKHIFAIVQIAHFIQTLITKKQTICAHTRIVATIYYLAISHFIYIVYFFSSDKNLCQIPTSFYIHRIKSDDGILAIYYHITYDLLCTIIECSRTSKLLGKISEFFFRLL